MIYKLHENTWTPANLSQDFPFTSFPADLPTAFLPDGYAYCHPSSPPVCCQYERFEQAEPAMVDGKLTQQWVTSYLPVPDIVAVKLSEIRAERKRTESLPVELDGVPYDMDATARSKYVETALTFAAVPDLEIPGWKASDDPGTGLGNYVTMTRGVLDSVWALGLAQSQAAFSWESARQAEVDAAVMAGDVAALIAVPTTYGGEG